MGRALRDQNYVPTLTGVDINDLTTPVAIAADAGLNRLYVSAIVTSASTVDLYKVNDFDDDDPDNEYYGYATDDEDWQIRYLTPTALRYATLENNPSVTSYATAWTTRAALTYERSFDAFE